jgi:hypothetical protein
MLAREHERKIKAALPGCNRVDFWQVAEKCHVVLAFDDGSDFRKTLSCHTPNMVDRIIEAGKKHNGTPTISEPTASPATAESSGQPADGTESTESESGESVGAGGEAESPVIGEVG